MTGKLVNYPLLALLVFCALATDAGAKSQYDRTFEYYESARSLFEKGDYRGTVIQLKNAVRLSPDDLPSRILLGQAHLRRGNGAAAEKAFRRASNSGANDPSLTVLLGRALLLQRKFKLLLDDVRGGTSRGSTAADILALRGKAHLALKEKQSAEENFKEALGLAPNQSDALIGMAQLRHSQNKLDEAEALIDRAIKIAPESSDAWRVKGQILHARRDFTQALDHLSKAVELSDDQIQARISRAVTLINLDRNQEALEDILAVRGLLPNNAQAAYLNALVFTMEQKSAEADEALRDAANTIDSYERDVFIKNPDILLLRGIVSFALRQFQDAFNKLSRYVELEPHRSGVRKLLGALLLRQNKHDEAITMLETAEKISPDDVEILLLLGRAYMQARQYKKAYPTFQRAAELAPARTSVRLDLALSQLAIGETKVAMDNLEVIGTEDIRSRQAAAVFGLVTLDKRDTTSALKIADQLVAKDPKNPFPHNLAGAAYLQRGDIAKARESFERVLSLAPNYPLALLNLASIDLREGKPEIAKQRYLRILEIDPEEPRAMLALFQLAERAGDTAEAIEWLKRVGELKVTILPARVKLVSLYLSINRHEEAEKLIRQLEKKFPRDPSVLDVKARAEAAAGDTEKARETLRAASFRTAESPQAMIRIALAQIELNDFGSARATLKAVVDSHPDYLPAHGALVTIEARSGGAEKALQLAISLRDTYPKSSVGDLLVGDILMLERRYREAEAAYRAGTAKTNNAKFAIRLFQARAKQGKLRTAFTSLRTWNAVRPGNPGVERMIATAYMSIGSLDNAIHMHESLLMRRPRDTVILSNLSRLYQRRGDPRAVELAQRALDLSPNNAAIIANYGWILVQQGEPSRGLRLLRNAELRMSDRSSIGYYIAATLSRLGRDDEALTVLKRLLVPGHDFKEATAASALLQQLEQK